MTTNVFTVIQTLANLIAGLINLVDYRSIQSINVPGLLMVIKICEFVSSITFSMQNLPFCHCHKAYRMKSYELASVEDRI